MRVVQEALRRSREPVEEDIYRFVDLVVILVCDCDVEKAVE